MKPFPLSLLAGAPVLCALLCSPAFAQNDAVPVVADYDMEGDGARLVDRGPLKLDGQLQNAARVAGRRGQALRVDGAGSFAKVKAPLIDALGAKFSVTGWVKVERFPRGRAWVVSKGGNEGWQWGVAEQKSLSWHGNWGGGWYESGGRGKIPDNEWAHFAFTFTKGDRARIFINGREEREDSAPYAFWKVDDPLRLGGGDWAGLLDDVRLFATALTPEQVALDAKNELRTRAAVASDIPPRLYPVRAALARWDAPIPFAEMHGRHKQSAQRVEGPDRVDWPQLELKTESGTIALWRESADQQIEVPFADEPRNRPLFRQPYDNQIVPSGQWFRALPWLWNQNYVYTSERTARTSSSDFELWTFPVLISQPNAPTDARPIKSVSLELNGKIIYERVENLRSLTLLLPQPVGDNARSKYLLRVNGGAAVSFDVGLLPVRLGAPEDDLSPLGQKIPGTPLSLSYGAPPWTNAKEWADDLKAAAEWKPGGAQVLASTPGASTWASRVGLEVARSPLEIFSPSMSHGMSGGHFFESPHGSSFKGTPEEYAAFLGAQGYDRVFETIHVDLLRRRADDYDRWIAAMEKAGVRAGVNVSGWSHGAMAGHANMALFASALPEWRAPLWRDYQLTAARFARARAFRGVFTGADNAGYVPYWDWAPPIPNRPWARAWAEWQRSLKSAPSTSASTSASTSTAAAAQVSPALTSVPVGPGASPQKDYEKKSTQREFARYIADYDRTFAFYGEIGRAVHEVAPSLAFSIGSFGSSPGVGGRGGWPWATVPARDIFSGLDIQTAYDWNEVESSKPMHNVALVDRLKSHFPNKTTWSIVDDFGMHFDRATRGRAYALTLARGVQGLGTNFLAHTTSSEPKFSLEPRATVVADQREIFAWAKKLGGVWANARPITEVGILYVHAQAASRPVIGGEDAPLEKILRGSHEGKTTEALWLSHAAGFPARIVSDDELKRGLNTPLKVLMLVGLNRFDNTWAWSDGLEDALKKFVAGGGTLVLDDESVVPAGVAARKTEMAIAAYIIQSHREATPLLYERNKSNIAALRQVLAGLKLERPLAIARDENLWSVPFESGDLQGVVVVNQQMREVDAPTGSEGAKKRLTLAPRTAGIEWKTARPVFDASPGRAQVLALGQAPSEITFEREGAAVFLLPPRPATAPRLQFSPDNEGWMVAEAEVGTPAMRGVPLHLEISKGGESATIWTASGRPTRLPVRVGESGFSVRATELLSQKSSEAQVPILQTLVSTEWLELEAERRRLQSWAERKGAPIVVALTPEQAGDAGWKKLAADLSKYLQGRGRAASVRTIGPGNADGVVRGLQAHDAIQRFPQWRTDDADLVLFGTPRDNVLILDQWRGRLLPADTKSQVVLARSPFIGGRDALNVLASTAAQAQSLLALLMTAPPAPKAGAKPR
jgi:hypothetical protein